MDDGFAQEAAESAAFLEGPNFRKNPLLVVQSAPGVFGNDIATSPPYMHRHGNRADHDYDHYHLGYPGAVGRALSAYHCHPVAGGAVSSSQHGFKTTHRPYRCASACPKARFKRDGI